MLVQPYDYYLVAWFILAGLSTTYVAFDQFRNNPEPAVMRWGFILVTLYMGPIGLLLYVLADKEPRPGEHEKFIASLWKQGFGSTIHCVAGDATGIILTAVITASLGLPMWVDLIVEYFAGFAFGLFIFQSLFMKSMMGGTYLENVRKSFLPEFISMNFMMAGMAPIMSLLMMGRDMRAMDPTELLFWGVMSMGVIAGFTLAYPSNVWLVKRNLKHGLMTERTKGGRSDFDSCTPATSKEHKKKGLKQGGYEGHGAGHGMQTEATLPQVFALGSVSLLALLTGMAAPVNWINMRLSAHEVGGLIMPAGMRMERDTPADAMRDMSYADPSCTSVIAGATEQAADKFVAYRGRARAYFTKQDWDRSIIDLDLAIQLFPSIAEAYIERGAAYDRKGDIARTISDFSTAINIAPRNPLAFGNRGSAHFRKAAYDLALADFDEAIRLDPRYSVAHNRRGVSHAMNGEYRKAIADFSEAIRQNGFYANAYYNRGKAYTGIGDFVSAISDLKMAVQIESNPNFYNELAWTYFRSGEALAGLPLADQALRLNPGYAAAYDTRAAIYEELGENLKAIADLKMALALDPALTSSASLLRRLTQNSTVAATFADVVQLVQKQGWRANLGDLCEKFDLPNSGKECVFHQISVEETKGQGDPRGLNVPTTSNGDPQYILIFHLKPLAGEFFVVSTDGLLIKAFVRFKGSDYNQVANEDVSAEFNEDITYWTKNFARLKQGLEAERSKPK